MELESDSKLKQTSFENLEAIIPVLVEVLAFQMKSSLMERKVFIKSFVKEAGVKDNEVSFIYTMPIAPQKITSEELAVLPIIHYGGRYWI